MRFGNIRALGFSVITCVPELKFYDFMAYAAKAASTATDQFSA